MKLDLHIPVALAAVGAALPAAAASLNLSLEIPRQEAGNARSPYVAVWLERPDQSVVGNLAVWYDLKKRNNAGTKWVNEMRTWWRKVGRETALPADGVSGPTRPPGMHALTFADTQTLLEGLPAGQYQVVVEVAREHGGDEVVRLPLQWPPRGTTRAQASGTQELGAVSLEVRP